MNGEPGQADPSFFHLAGPAGIAALLVGLVVLVLGILVAARQGRRRHALALFAAAWLPVPLGLFGRALGEVAAMNEIARLGPALTAKDMAKGLESASASTGCAMLALFLGLAGSIAALARSREDRDGGA